MNKMSQEEIKLQKNESSKIMLAKKSNIGHTLPMDFDPPVAKVVEVAEKTLEHTHAE